MVKYPADSLDRVFGALADPTRRAILQSVSKRACTVGEVAKPFRMSLAAISKHLTVLERAGLVRRQKKGSFRQVSLNAEALMSAGRWIGHYQQFWIKRLDALQDFLEREET